MSACDTRALSLRLFLSEENAHRCSSAITRATALCSLCPRTRTVSPETNMTCMWEAIWPRRDYLKMCGCGRQVLTMSTSYRALCTSAHCKYKNYVMMAVRDISCVSCLQKRCASWAVNSCWCVWDSKCPLLVHEHFVIISSSGVVKTVPAAALKSSKRVTAKTMASTEDLT